MGLFRAAFIIALPAAALLAFWARLPDDQELHASLAGKSVVITGASKGIGEQLAYVACSHGAAVLLTARTKELLDKVASRCRDLGAQSVAVQPADMSSERDVLELYQAIRNAFPLIHHVVINHAWMIPPDNWRGSAENMTTLRRIMDINFHAYVQLASLTQDMLEASQGRLTVVSSVLGKTGMPFYAPYVSTKFALQGFFTSLQHELYMAKSPLTVTIAVIGRIGYQDTETQRRLTSSGNFLRRQDDTHTASDVGETATAILKASAGRWRELYFPQWVRLIDPAYAFPVVKQVMDHVIAFAMERGPA